MAGSAKSRRGWGPPTLWAQHGGTTEIPEQDRNIGVFIPIFGFDVLGTTSICYRTNPAYCSCWNEKPERCTWDRAWGGGALVLKSVTVQLC